jgi:hypothetical protein
MLFKGSNNLVQIYNKFLSPTSILECNSHKIKIFSLNILNFVIDFWPHYLDVDTILELHSKILVGDKNLL